MATTFTWTIANLERNSSDGGVTVAHWRCDGVDGDNSSSAYGTVGFTPDAEAEGFVAFESLTEETVLGWVQAEVSQEDTEASIQSKIDEMANPTSLSGLAW